MTAKIVQDCFATMYSRLREGESHPFCVYLRFTDGTHSQEIQCRDLVGCRMVGNGMLSALTAVDIRYETVNVVFDPRFETHGI